MRLALLGVAAVLSLSIAWLAPSPASAAHSFCGQGIDAGECDQPEGLAINQASGEIYVVDRANHRVNVFNLGGEFRLSFGWGVADGDAELQSCGPVASSPSSVCLKGLAGSGPGQFATPRAIAIDNTGGPGQGTVYVGTDNFRVQKFSTDGEFLTAFGWDVNKTKVGEGAPQAQRNICPIDPADECGAGVRGTEDGAFGRVDNPLAIGPAGVIHVGDKFTLQQDDPPRISKFAPTGALLETVAPTPGPDPKRRMRGLAVDSGGNIYASYDNVAINHPHKYGSDGVLLGELDPLPATGALAVDATDDLYAGSTYQGFQIVSKYTAMGALLKRYGYGEILGLPITGLAVHSATGEVFVSQGGFLSGEEGSKVLHLAPPPPGPLTVPASVRASPVGNTKATLRAQVNPEGKETTYHFEYVEEGAYQVDVASGGDGFADAVRVPEGGSEDPVVGDDFDVHLVSAEIGCPDPVSEAGLPGNSCLTPETNYRFRFAATNEDGAGNSPIEGAEFETAASLELLESWSTQVGTDSAVLNAEVNPGGIPATGRFQYVEEGAYLEDVEAGGDGFAGAAETADVDFGAAETPTSASIGIDSLERGATYRYRILAKNPLIELLSGPTRALTTQRAALPRPPCPNDVFRAGYGAFLPECRAYELVSPLDKAGGDIVTIGNIDNNPAELNQSAVAPGKLAYSSYRAFGDAQSAPFTSQYIATREGGKGEWVSRGISPARGVNLLGLATLETPYKAFSADLCQGWLLHDTDPPLAPGAVEGYANLYRREDCAGPATFETVSRAGPEAPPRSPEKFFSELQGISADGAVAIHRIDARMSVEAPNLGENQHLLYASGGGLQRLVCVLPGGVTIGSGCSAGTAYGNVRDGRGDFLEGAISADGSRVYWTAAVNGPGALYVRKNPLGIGGECATAAAPCTLAVGTGAFWGAARDGSVALFQTGGGELRKFDLESGTSEVIAGQAEGVVGMSADADRVYFVSREDKAPGAEVGNPNLYLHEQGEFTHVATLAERDLAGPVPVPSPVNPQPFWHAARVSEDGGNAVFMSNRSLSDYDSTDALSGEPAAQVYRFDAVEAELRCISCNPTGARPVAREVLAEGRFGTGVWAAGRISHWVSQLYAPRVLSDGGERLFFESQDALVARDTNGAQDVYQWQRAEDEDECQAKGAELFVQSAGGCISLISSGKGPEDSHFIDASADGTDAFIATGASLLAHDPGLVDIYAARIEGGLPPPPAPKAFCEGEACQSPPAPPVPSPPASSAFSGPGNLPPPPLNCAAQARRAQQLSSRAKRLLRTSRRAKRPARSRTLRRQANRFAKQAKRQSIRAKRCRIANNRRTGGG